MARTLIVPGVGVTTKFEVTPPLPARSGILGAVGIVDDATIGVAGVTARQELLDLYGPATQFSFPEALSALSNGISEVVVSPVPGGGRAQSELADSEGQAVVRLVARAAGPWGNSVAVRVSRRLAPDGQTVRNVSIQVLLDGEVVENHEGLILAAGHDQDIFTVINRDSRVLVALDPEFGQDLPALDTSVRSFEDNPSVAAIRVLRGANDQSGDPELIDVTADAAGAAGNNISVSVEGGRSTAILPGAAANSVAARIRTPEPPTPASPAFAVQVLAGAQPQGGVNLQIRRNADTTTVSNLTTVQAFRDAVEAAGLMIDRTADTLPAVMANEVLLSPSRSVVVVVEGVGTTRYDDLLSAQDVVDALANDQNVTAARHGNASTTDLPGVTSDTTNAYLSGGRDSGPARQYPGQTLPNDMVLDLLPAPDSDAASTRFRVRAGSAPSTVRIEVGSGDDADFQLREVHEGLSMDPDSPRYLPKVLSEESDLLRAIDRYPRRGVTTFPADVLARRLSGGTMPPLGAYEAAIDALAMEDSVDLMLAGMQRWADPNLDGIEVQQAMLGHALAQSDNAKPRIVLGSIPPDLNENIDGILDHANQVRNRRFALVAPSGAEGAVAGSLGHLEFYQSPTFKTVASPGVELVPYRESELNEMLGPDGNVLVISSRRGKGVIVVRGLTTDGSQISVVRVADRAVREVKAISDRFIGELNNADIRNALKQMIVARFTQLERDGAIVPSVDGSSPAFQVEVYASQVDAATGIVRVDIAVRPVREIAFVYATVTVQL